MKRLLLRILDWPKVKHDNAGIVIQLLSCVLSATGIGLSLADGNPHGSAYIVAGALVLVVGTKLRGK